MHVCASFSNLIFIVHEILLWIVSYGDFVRSDKDAMRRSAREEALPIIAEGCQPREGQAPSVLRQ